MMGKKEKKINTSARIVIPKNSDRTVEESRMKILKNLESISNDDIENIGNEMECKRIMNIIKGRNGDITIKDVDFIITNGFGDFVCEYINHFQAEYHKRLALKILNNDPWGTVPDFDNFDSGIFDSELALAFIKKRFTKYVEKRRDFTGRLNKEVAEELYKADSTFLSLDKFINEDRKDIALFYIEKGQNDINLSDCDCDEEFAKQILGLKNLERFNILCYNIEEFPKQIRNAIALDIINAGGAEFLYKNLNEHRDGVLDKEAAFGLFGYLGENLQNIKSDILNYIMPENRKDIALYLIDHGITPSLTKIAQLDLDFANKIIDKGEIHYLLRITKKFLASDHKNILMNILDSKYDNFYDLYHNLNMFSGKDKEVAMKLFEYAKHHDGFSNSATDEMARYIANSPNEFTGLDDEIASLLIDLGYGAKVKQYKKHYSDLKTRTKIRLLTK